MFNFESDSRLAGEQEAKTKQVQISHWEEGSLLQETNWSLRQGYFDALQGS